MNDPINPIPFVTTPDGRKLSNYFIANPSVSNGGAFLTLPGNDTSTLSITATNPGFGRTTNAYRDSTVSGTNDPGGRLIEFQLRFNF